MVDYRLNQEAGQFQRQAPHLEFLVKSSYVFQTYPVVNCLFFNNVFGCENVKISQKEILWTSCVCVSVCVYVWVYESPKWGCFDGVTKVRLW